MKNVHILLLLVFAFIFSCNSEKKKETKEEPSKPNVLFIAVDDLNNWISPIMGFSNAKTPNFI